MYATILENPKYAPDITDINVENLLSTLERETSILLEWFKFNEMKLNEDICHLLLANQSEDKSIRLGNETVVSRRSVELLGAKIDEHLNFKENTSQNYAKKATRNSTLLLASLST